MSYKYTIVFAFCITLFIFLYFSVSSFFILFSYKTNKLYWCFHYNPYSFCHQRYKLQKKQQGNYFCQNFIFTVKYKIQNKGGYQRSHIKPPQVEDMIQIVPGNFRRSLLFDPEQFSSILFPLPFYKQPSYISSVHLYQFVYFPFIASDTESDFLIFPQAKYSPVYFHPVFFYRKFFYISIIIVFFFGHIP